jgi:D-alanyl-D-alanine carboxypeptidase
VPRPTVPRRAGAVFAAAAGLALVGAGWIGASGGFATPAGSPGGSSAVPVGPSSETPGFTPVPAPSASPSPVAIASSSPAASPSPEPRALLENRLAGTLDRVRAKLGIPGVSATILFPDGSSWTGVSGLADVGGRVPVTADTPFAVASMSKTFTAAEILSLVDEGRLRLSDSAARFVPAGLPIKLDPRITIAMLLDHTSGLADYFLNPKIDPALLRAPTKTWSASDALRFVGKRLSPPGAAFHYANTNYLLLGLIAENVSGRPLPAEIRRRFLDPLHLAETWYQAAEDDRGLPAHGYRLPGTKPTAKPIDLADSTGVTPFRSVVTAAGGAGSIAATSGDLARWARALYGGDVLGPIGTALMLSDFTKATGYIRGVSYGYGVQALSIDGHASLGHSGRLLGFRGAMRHFPVEGFTIAVLTNQSRADPAAIVRSLLRIVVPPAPVPVAWPVPSSRAAAPSASPPASAGAGG